VTVGRAYSLFGHVRYGPIPEGEGVARYFSREAACEIRRHIKVDYGHHETRWYDLDVMCSGSGMATILIL
jgi:hypothetical protein